jgi:hypothetical protein
MVARFLEFAANFGDFSALRFPISRGTSRDE